MWRKKCGPSSKRRVNVPLFRIQAGFCKAPEGFLSCYLSEPPFTFTFTKHRQNWNFFTHYLFKKRGSRWTNLQIIIYKLRETPTSMGLSRQKFAESNLRGKLGSWILHLWFCTAPLSYPNFWKNYVHHVVNADFDSQDLNKLRDKTLLILPLSLLLPGWQRLEAFRRG